MKRLWPAALGFCILIFGAQGRALAEGEQISLGFPAFSAGLNYLNDAHPAAAAVRQAVTGGVGRREKAGRSQAPLGLSDSLSVSADYALWSFRLREQAWFQNGRLVRAGDVKYSLERCQREGVLPAQFSVETRQSDSGGESREWIDIRLDPRFISQERLLTLEEVLSRCPVVEKESSVVFEETLGTGTNLISTGPFGLTAFKSGGEIVLERTRRFRTDDAPTRTVSLRGFENAEQGLIALRTGTLDAFFTNNQQVIEKAQKDETLLSSSCLTYSVLKRKGFELPCPEEPDILGMRYMR